MRVADQLAERAQPLGLGPIDADGGDLDPVRRVGMAVAVDLGVKDDRPLRDLAHASLVRLVHPPGAFGGDLLRRRTARHTLERPVHLVPAPGALARVRLDVEAGRDDDAEPRAAAELGGDVRGARVGDSVGRRHHDPGAADRTGEPAGHALELRDGGLRHTAGQERRGDRHANRPPASPARAHSPLRASGRAASGCRPFPIRSPATGPTGPGSGPACARGAPRARASGRRAAAPCPAP